MYLYFIMICTPFHCVSWFWSRLVRRKTHVCIAMWELASLMFPTPCGLYISGTLLFCINALFTYIHAGIIYYASIPKKSIAIRIYHFLEYRLCATLFYLTRNWMWGTECYILSKHIDCRHIIWDIFISDKTDMI